MDSAEFLAMVKKSKIVHLCFAISFFTSGLIINVAQAVLFYSLKPLNKRLYRKINYYLCYSYFSRECYRAACSPTDRFKHLHVAL